MWPFLHCCCCRLPLFVTALLRLIAAAAAVGCQAAAPSAAAALAALLQGLPLAAPLLLRILGRTLVCSAVLQLPAWTCDRTIGTSQPTTVPARQDMFNQARPGQDSVAASLSIVWALIHSSDEDLYIHPDCPCPPLAVLRVAVKFNPECVNSRILVKITR